MAEKNIIKKIEKIILNRIEKGLPLNIPIQITKKERTQYFFQTTAQSRYPYISGTQPWVLLTFKNTPITDNTIIDDEERMSGYFEIPFKEKTK